MNTNRFSFILMFLSNRHIHGINAQNFKRASDNLDGRTALHRREECYKNIPGEKK